MKKILALLFMGVLISFTSCGEKKDSKKPEKITIQSGTETKKEEPKKAESASTTNADLVAKGQQLFKDKTCFTCHQPKVKAIGPSIIDINKVYKDNNASLITFLKSESKAIVDTNPAQVAIMKANLDGFVKDLSDDELNALEAYMLSVN